MGSPYVVDSSKSLSMTGVSAVDTGTQANRTPDVGATLFGRRSKRLSKQCSMVMDENPLAGQITTPGVSRGGFFGPFFRPERTLSLG